MRVLFIVPSLKNAGPVIVVYDLVHLLIKRGHKCCVCYFDKIEELKFGCEVVQISMRQKINFSDYDIVHTHGYRPQLYVFLHKSWNKSSTRFVTTMHNYLFSDFGYTYGKIRGLIYGTLYLLVNLRADKIVALSKDAQHYYSRFLPSCKLTYAYNTRVCDFSKKLSTEEERELLAFRGESARLVGTSCALSPLKGLDLIIQALQELPQTKFCIIGDGKIKNDLIQLSVKLKVSDRVLFLGYKKDAYKYLPYFDVYAIPSHSEGFPLAMLEAAAYGKSIVASNLSVFKEIFTGDEISIFDLNDEKSVPNAIERAFLEKEKLSRNAKLKYGNVYSPDNFVSRYLAIYTKLLLE